MLRRTSSAIEEKDLLLIVLVFPPYVLENESKLDALFAFEDVLREIVEINRVGTVDGNEIGDTTITFFIYGKNADAIYDILFPVLSRFPFRPGSYVIKHYRGKNPHEELIML